MARCPLKMTRSKQESTATIKLVNLATKRDSVFMAFSFGKGWIKPHSEGRTPYLLSYLVAALPRWDLVKITSRLSKHLVDFPCLNLIEGSRGGGHGSLFCGCRGEDEAAVRLAVREGPPALRRRRGRQARAWRRRVHRPALVLRSQDDPARPEGLGGARGPGGGSGPKKRGGRRPLTAACPSLEDNLRQLLQEFTAGDPMREGVLWTNLSLRELSRRLLGMGTPASRRTIRRLLRKLKIGRRTARKKKTMGHHPDRNAQFENIARLRQEYQAAGDPVISIDTKKKELLGNFHRDGQTYTEQTVETFDHDFPSAGAGQADPARHLRPRPASKPRSTSTPPTTRANSAATASPCGGEEHGRAAYPEAKRLLILCDGGGSNSATQYLFKEDLQRLADRLGLELRVAHYPPYCSKHNPIEHRVFPHITRACQGVIFHSVEIAKQFIERAKTTTGLRVTVSLLDKVYATGRKYAEGFKTTMKILFDDHLPKWNYRALPQTH